MSPTKNKKYTILPKRLFCIIYTSLLYIYSEGQMTVDLNTNTTYCPTKKVRLLKIVYNTYFNV